MPMAVLREHRDDAKEMPQILEVAGVWHRITPNAEGSVEDED